MKNDYFDAPKCQWFFACHSQGRNEVYFFIADPVFLRKFLIPDPKSDENFDP